MARHRRPVGPPIEGMTLRREKDRHRPASAPGQCLHGCHVDLIQVGALLAVHLDADKVRVQQPGDLLILERFVCHHMAPMTGGVANAQKDGFVLGAGPQQGLLSPRIPVNRIASMLAQVRT